MGLTETAKVYTHKTPQNHFNLINQEKPIVQKYQITPVTTITG